MTNDITLWATLHEHLPRKTWIPIEEIYQIVQRNVPLDTEDLGCRGMRSASPHWKRNVRRILHSKHREGALMSRVSQ
jgi:hypothetical protein